MGNLNRKAKNAKWKSMSSAGFQPTLKRHSEVTLASKYSKIFFSVSRVWQNKYIQFIVGRGVFKLFEKILIPYTNYAMTRASTSIGTYRFKWV